MRSRESNGWRSGLQPPAVTAILAACLAAVCTYGLWSTPELAERWGFSWSGIALLLAWLGLAGLAVPIARRAPGRLAWVALGAIALLTRIGVAGWTAGRTPDGDAEIYRLLAARLLHGEGLAFFEPYMGITVRAFFPPAYPLLLAGWGGALGLGTASLIALNLLLDGAAAWLVWRIGAALDRLGAGRAAAWLYLIWPSVLLSAPLAQKESLCVVLVLALALAWLRVGQGSLGGWRAALAIGVLAGLLALAQPGQAPLAALFGLAMVPQAGWRRVLGTGVAALLPAALVLLPWWVRNWLLFHAFVPLTSAGKLSLWVGNNPDANGDWLPSPQSLRGLPELVQTQAAAAMAKAWIVSHPGAFLWITASKFARATGVAQFGIDRLALMTPAVGAAVTALLLPLSQGAHLGMLGAGAATLLRRGRAIPRPLLYLVLAGALQLPLFAVWFEFGERHREFLTPLLLLMLAAALVPPRD